MLRHTAPPGLKRWGRIAIVAALAIAVTGIGLAAVAKPHHRGLDR